MKVKNPILLAASAAALALALSQEVLAEPVSGDTSPTTASPASEPATTTETEQAQPAAAPEEGAGTQTPAAEPKAAPPASTQTPPTVTAHPSPPTGLAAARERMEKKHAEMMQERKRRYEELRIRAAEVGLDLPETPPWEQEGMQPPEIPTPPAPPKVPGEMAPPWTQMSAEKRKAEWEKMRNMTAEEREAMREKRWQDLRKRAKEQGVDLPETPPWKQAEERREAMKAKWEQYQKIVDGLTAEQKDAARAVFGRGGRPVPPMPYQMPPTMPMDAPCGPGYGAPGSMMPPGTMMPGYGGQDAGPAMYERGPGAPWYGGGEPSRKGPPPPSSYNQPW
jgi:hypothetical protein